jgi:hypothetical protein
MNIIESFEYVKTFIAKIRKDKIPRGLVLQINTKFYTDEELASIIYFEGIIKKMCKLDGIIYNMAL